MDLQVDITDKGTHDMLFINGECPVKTNEGDVVAQRLFIMLRTFQQEWFLNLDHGVPYWSILGSKLPKESIDRILQAKVLAEEGVAEIITWTSTLDNTKRIYECRFNVRTTNGAVTQTITVSP
jgi:hypothetical protein